ncbi:MAG: hypothetical protein IKJ30_00015 [Bacilli bacterium]|nr:hypothetical protein [Bacilli bacterium]
MKRVIRRGVFETNSSSSHSLSLVRVERNASKVKKDVSFEIRSRVAKAVFILGLIDNADDGYMHYWDILEDNEEAEEERQKIIKRLYKSKDEGIEKIKEEYGNVEKLSFYNLIESIEEHCHDKYPILGKVKNYDVNDALIHFSSYRKEVLKFKEFIIKAFCELEKINKKEAMDKLYYEAYKNIPLENILLHSNNKEEDLKEFMKSVFMYDFKQGYKKSKNKDIVEYAKKYLVSNAKRSIKQHDGRFYCTRYFREGCLNDCYCGFEDFNHISWNLIGTCVDDESLYNRAKELLSDNYKFQAVEMYCGSYFEGNGEIY